MRAVQTFILRLVFDAAEPEALRGVVQCVATDETRAFGDPRALVSALPSMAEQAMQGAPARRIDAAVSAQE